MKTKKFRVKAGRFVLANENEWKDVESTVTRLQGGDWPRITVFSVMPNGRERLEKTFQ